MQSTVKMSSHYKQKWSIKPTDNKDEVWQSEPQQSAAAGKPRVSNEQAADQCLEQRWGSGSHPVQAGQY